MLKYCHKPCNCQYLQGFWLLHGMQGVSGSSPLGSTAIEIKKAGLDVSILGKRPKTDAHTVLAKEVLMLR